jgi:quinol monooxygenase YgiN
MAIYQTGDYRVKPASIEKVKHAIKDLVRHVQAEEPGTKLFLAWQQKDDPARFLHFFIFEDAAAQERHGRSAAVKRFEAVYGPELVEGDVTFTDFMLIAGKR